MPLLTKEKIEKRAPLSIALFEHIFLHFATIINFIKLDITISFY